MHVTSMIKLKRQQMVRLISVHALSMNESVLKMLNLMWTFCYQILNEEITQQDACMILIPENNVREL